jgi:hypothetical protein
LNVKKTTWGQDVWLSWLVGCVASPRICGIVAVAIATLLAEQTVTAEQAVGAEVVRAVSGQVSGQVAEPALLNQPVPEDTGSSSIDGAASSKARLEIDSRISQALFEPLAGSPVFHPVSTGWEHTGVMDPSASQLSLGGILLGQAAATQPAANQFSTNQLSANQLSANQLSANQLALDGSVPGNGVPNPTDKTVRRAGSDILGKPTLKLQGVYKLEGEDSSARARLTGLYPITPDVLVGAVVDWTTGRGFSDSQDGGLSLNELYVAVSPSWLPRFRLIGGLMDYTSYFDRNSFAKDGASHFFNRVFQTNPALSAAGLASRPGLIANWSVTDNLDVKGGVFSSRRSLGDFALDGSVAEVAWRIGTLIMTGTYISAKDAGRRTGFEEIFQFDRGGNTFGLSAGDREKAYGFNAEYYLPQLNMGFFGRYGHYTNSALDESGDTYSFGTTFLDLFRPNDRLGIGYGRQLSNNDLRRSRDDKRPDVLEVYYDIPIRPYLRGAVMIQARDQFSEVVLGIRIKTEINLIPLGAPFRR